MTDVKNKTWEQYQNGVSWQRSMKFPADFPRFVRFKEGEQWPEATDRTRNFPRPVFNICDMFVTSLVLRYSRPVMVVRLLMPPNQQQV